MRKVICVVLSSLLILSFVFFAIGSGSSGKTKDQGSGSATGSADSALGDCEVEIKSCRLAKDYEGKKVAIVTYNFTNRSDTAQAFFTAVSDAVYQDGVGLNKAYFLDDSANYSEDNQTKEIKKDASIDVEVAYVLNDSDTDLEVEVKEWISLNDDKITKTFKIAQ